MSKGFWEGFTTTAGERTKNQIQATKRWRENNRERYLAKCAEYTRKWATENRERRRETQRAYYYRHREKELERKKEYQRTHKDKTNAASKRYYAYLKSLKTKQHCINCESIVQEGIYCSWCIKTYNLNKNLMTSI